MKNFILPIAFIFFSSISFSANLDWAKTMGASWYDVGHATTTDSQGNVYVTGYFHDSVDFDPDPDSFYILKTKGINDIFVLKLDKDGNLVWVRQIGSTQDDNGMSLCLDKWNNVIVTGFFRTTTDFNPDPNRTFNLTSIGSSSSLFVLKLNNDGIFIWARAVTSTGGLCAGLSIATDNKGNIYYASEFNNSVTDFDPGAAIFNLTPVRDRDACISKLDSGGKFVWAKQIGGRGYETIRSITVDSGGVVYLAGDINRDADLDPGPGTYAVIPTDLQFFVMKLTTTGSLTWVKVMPPGLRFGNAHKAITLDDSGFIYLAGDFAGTIDFDPDTSASTTKTSQGKRDLFVMKINAVGKLVWVRTAGGTGTPTAEGYSIDTDRSGNVYTAGAFYGTVDFNPGGPTYHLGATAVYEAFIQKLDSAGNFIWAKSLKGKGIAHSISIDPYKNIFITGEFQNTVDFNPDSSITDTMSSLGKGDIFIMRLQQCKGSASSMTASACGSYSLLGKTFSTSGIHQITIANYSGCDSVITLNLTIHKSSDSTISIQACDSFVLNDSVYRSSGVYSQKLQNAKGCDSSLTLELVIRESSDTNIHVMACDSFNWQQTTYFRSGIYKHHLLSRHNCDSNVTLYVQIGNTKDTIEASVCDSFVLNGKTYKQTGHYAQHLTNSNGCDSLLVLILKVNKSASSITVNACKSYLLNQITYDKSGNYIQTIKNAAGCDSTIALKLTLNKIDTAIARNVNQLIASTADTAYAYQWINCLTGNPLTGETDFVFNPAVNGSYAVVITLNLCSDTSKCYNFLKTGINGWNGPERMALYPNPSQDGKTGLLVRSGMDNAFLWIYDGLGRKVSGRISIREGYNILDVSGLAPGIYYLEVSQNSSVSRISFLISQ